MVTCTPTKRARIVNMRNHGHSYGDIAKEFGINRSTACRVFTKYAQSQNYYAPITGRGRPRKMDSKDRLLAARRIRGGFAADATDLQRQEFPDISPETVRRELRSIGLYGRRRRRKFLLMKRHVRNRRKWARDHEGWNVETWQQVIFTDESKFHLFGSDGIQYCRRGPGEELEPRNVIKRVKHGGGKVMVWGCMTGWGWGRLVRVTGNMNAVQYCEILEEGLLGTLEDYGLNADDVIFQQDNDPKHTSKRALEWIRSHGFQKLDWPANSPDMSIIEHAWYELEKRVAKRRVRPRSEDELWAILQAEWAALSKDLCDRLYSSMPRRVASLANAKGGHTKY